MPVSSQTPFRQFPKMGNVDVEIIMGQVKFRLAPVCRPHPVNVWKEGPPPTLLQPIQKLKPRPGNEVPVGKKKRNAGTSKFGDHVPGRRAQRPSLCLMPTNDHISVPTVQGFDMMIFKERAIRDEFDKLERLTGTQQALMNGLNLGPVKKWLTTPIGDLVDAILLQEGDDFFNKAIRILSVMIWWHGTWRLQAIAALKIAGITQKYIKHQTTCSVCSANPP